MLIFFLKKYSEFEKRGPQNFVSLIFIIDVTITKRPIMNYCCLLQCGVNCSSTETISAGRWKELGTKTKDWKGLGKFVNVFESTDWEKGVEWLRVHERFNITLSSTRWLQLSRKRKEKESAEKTPTIPEQ